MYYFDIFILQDIEDSIHLCIKDPCEDLLVKGMVQDARQAKQ